MLDYRANRGRYLIMLGFAMIFLVAPQAYLKSSEWQVEYPLESPREATMTHGGAKHLTSLVFQDRQLVVTCKISRCYYVNWQNDLGRLVEIKLDKAGMVSSIVISGVTKIDATDISNLHKKWVLITVLTVIIGFAMLIVAS